MRIAYESDLTTLYHGDCLKVLPLFRDGTFDAVVTDPPYGISHAVHDTTGKYRRPKTPTIANDGDTVVGVAVLEWSEERGLPIAVFASPYLPWPGKWRSLLVWDKGPAVGGGGDTATCWKRTWELIQVARNKPLREGRDGAVLKHWIGPNKLHHHPTEKPVDLMRYLIRQLTPPGGTVLDPFAGSGTTLVAAAMEGRRAVGIELDEGYCDTAIKRLEALS